MATLRRIAAQEWTYRDYRRMPNDGRRYEVLEGELWMAPSPTTRHQEIVLNLVTALRSRVTARRLGRVFVAPYDVVLTENVVVQPDVVFVSKERGGIITEENIQGVPDLVVEVLSRGTRSLDRRRKKGIYERAGIPEYWVVDGDSREVAVHRLDPAGRTYGLPHVFRGGEVLTSSVLEGLELPLDQIWP